MSALAPYNHPSTPMQRYQRFLALSNISFKQHQLDGVLWCVDKETCLQPVVDGVRGGFIADEMGLGKTIMSIGICVANLLPRTLIVLPCVLISQWCTEILRTTGHTPLVYYGSDKKNITTAQLEAAHIVITSYHSIIVSKKNIVSPMHTIFWNRVIFDEAHHLRNKNNLFLGARSIKTQIRWLITGTPIQNKHSDFKNLCSVIGIPASLLSDSDLLHNHFILRRTKVSANIVLPELIVDKESVPWKSESERSLSQDIHTSLAYAERSEKLKLFIRARQICILPIMFRNNIEQMADDHIIRDNHRETVTHCSSKMDVVVDSILTRKGNGNGKLVFCHFREEIDTIIQRLSLRGLTNVSSFDGRTRQSSRIFKLKQKFEVLVLQIQTGCEGLNLQNDFNEVYFVSPHWNPSIEDQAVARCHRIGQTKPVHVFKYEMDTFRSDPVSQEIAESPLPHLTLDQYVAIKQASKLDISHSILERSEALSVAKGDGERGNSEGGSRRSLNQ